MSGLNKTGLSLFKIVLLLILVKSNLTLAQNPYIKPTSGIGQYGYLEKDASTTMLLNSDAQGNIYQLFGRTFLNGTNILTYGTAVNVCGFTTNVDQTTANYTFGANAIPGLTAYTSVHADYCDLTNSYGSNPNQIGYSERQHYIFDISDRPSDVTSNVIQINPGATASTNNVVMSVKIYFGTVSSRILQRFWIQNTGTLAEVTEIADDGFKLYYEPATGSETFDGTESSVAILGSNSGNPTNNNIYGSDALNISIPSGGLRVYVVLNKFASCLSTAKTVRVSLINDGLGFTPAMDTSYTLARVGQTPAAPTLLNVSLANNTTGPLGGTYYIPSACFPTIASAVTALNTNGVNAAVTFNVFAGYNETAPSGGFSLLGSGAAGNLATGTATNTITFKKYGTGANPLITASAVHTAGSTVDGIFKIVGGDYITLDGFTMIENAANVATTAMTEFGVALFYGTTTNGAQNNTIKNCSITLNKTNTNTFGIYSNTMHSSTSGTVSAAITNITGANSNNKFYSNTISNTNIGIVVNGSPGFENAGTDIGGASLATGNTITDQGVSAPATGYLGLPGTASYGIYVGNSNSSNISYNSITGNAAANNSYGIHLRSSSTSPTTTHTTTVSYNTIQVSCSSASASYNVVGILNDMGGTNHTLNITNNTIQNSTTTSTSFGGGFGGIWSKAALAVINISNNTFTNNVINGATLDATAANRSSFIKITNMPTTSITVSGNAITTNSFTNAGGGDVVAFDISGNYNSSCSIANNTINGLTTIGTGSTYGAIFGAYNGPTTVTGNTLKNISNTGSGSFYGTYISASHGGALNIINNIYQDITLAGVGSLTGITDTQTSVGTLTVSGNTFKNISNSVCSSSSWIRFVNSNTGSGQNLDINSNIIDNLILNPAVTNAGVTAIYTALSNRIIINNNSIKNITSSGPNVGIQTSGGSVQHDVYGNTIDGMTSSAAGALINHYGIYVSPATNLSNVYNNKVYNISSGTSTNATLYGIYAGFGSTCYIYNNMVGDLKLPNVTNGTASALRGIHVSTASNKVYNNTVYLNATSTGTDFSSAAFSFSGTGTLDLRNNIFVNNSTPKGVGYSAAIMRVATGTNGTVSGNYAATSNNNCLYAPSVTNGVIFVEGQYTGGSPTNIYPANCTDLTLFKAFVSARETNSFSEMPPFISVTAGAMDLHLNTGALSSCFNGGITLATVSSDIDGNARPMGTAYEIGADEANGTTTDRTSPVITYTPIGDVGCASALTTLTATITDANAIGSGANAPRLYFKKLSDPTNTIATVNNNSVSGWKYVVATGSYSFTINYSLLPGVLAEGEVIQYFVAAQDVSGNVATTSATVTPCVTSVVFTSGQSVSAPPTINQFTYRVTLNGNYTVGTGSGQNYPTLSGTGGLFDAINKGYVSGNITATVTSNTVETGAVSLNEWTEYNTVTCALSGATVYRLTVQSDGTVRTLEGTNLVYNATSLKAMINLNAADRVTFTGGTTTQRNLIFRTTNTAATSCVPVFQLGNGNGSNDIIIKNCDIQTNGISGSAPVSAGIYIANTGTNANNLFQLNDIHNAVSGTTGNPRYGVFADDNTGTVLQIKDNNFYNIYNKAIQLGSFSYIGNGQTITGNSIYGTGVGITMTDFTGIELVGSTASGHLITGNYIGGTSPLGGVAGTPWTNAFVTAFIGINVRSVPSQSAISGNVIRNLNLSSATAVTFYGIYFTGSVLCENNVIGDANNSAFGLTINAIGAPGTGTNSGIKTFSNGYSATVTIRNNIIRFITHNTVSLSDSGLIGVNVSGYPTASMTINNNTISDLFSNMHGGGNGYDQLSMSSRSMVTGIFVGGGSTSGNVSNIYENNINNLKITSTGTTTGPAVIGIAVDDFVTGSILRNKIYNLTNSFAGSLVQPGNITGIRVYSGVNTIANNMIYLNNGSNTNRCRVMGIFNYATSGYVHFNSVVIEGTDAGPAPTSGICSAPYLNRYSATVLHDIKNNIFINNRTGGTSATVGHYAMAFPQGSTATVSSNYNDLVNSVSTTYCRIGTTPYDLAAWRTLSTPATPDINSQNVTPAFIDAANGDLHLADSNCALDNKGTVVAITSDYDVPLITRASPPDIGADEFTSDFRLNITNPPVLKCTVSSVDLTVPAITTGGAGSSSGTTLTYWTDALASSALADPAAVTAEGTYYIKSVNGNCSAIKPVLVIKQGATWAGGTWVGSGGYPNGTMPDIETAVTIDDNYDTAVNGSFEACSLTVNSPSTIGTPCSVAIKPGATDEGYITLQNDLTVNPNGTLLVEDKGSLIMIDETGVVTNNGTTNVKRTTTPFERYDYVYWSAPVNDARPLSSIFSGWRTDYSFTFNTQNFADIAPADTFDDNGDAWTPAGSSATMSKAKGYAIMTPTTAIFTPSATPVTVTFSGAANNGVIPSRIFESANTADTNDDYNLIGNPYPSAISADNFINVNGTNTSGTLYFWTHVADISISNPGPDIYNFITADYALYNLSGGVASGTGSTMPSGYIASGQGFFVEAQNNNIDLVFNNSMRKRISGYRNDNFFRTSANTDGQRDRLWLNLQNPDGLFSQLLVGYFDETTLGFDWAYDGRVNTLNTQLSFYSLAENEKYKIQARPAFTDTDEVPLGYFSIANGEFTITLGQKDGVFNTDQNVYLEDRDMHIVHNLTQSPYTFTTTYGRYEDRFVLRYTDATLANPDLGALENSVFVAANHGEMTIKSSIEAIRDVAVYDILGRQLFEARSIGNKDFSSSNISMSQQTLIVKIKLENGTIVTRKIIL